MARLITILGFVCAFAAATLHAATFTVTTTADAGAGSLRQAILDANANGIAVTDTIAFNIPGAGVQTISPVTALPNITTPTLVDGYTQPAASMNTLPFANGNNAVILVALDGVNQSFEGLVVAASGSMVRGLSVQRFTFGIGVATTNATIIGNFIGTDATGLLDRGNGYGIFLEGSDDNQLGNIGPSNANVISGNEVGIAISSLGSDNTVAGNFIGAAADGVTALGNSIGVLIQTAQDNIIFDNLISGSTALATSSAIELAGASQGNIIAGNRIGTRSSGVGSVPNRYGITFSTYLMGSPGNNIIGTIGEGNTIANSLLSGINIPLSNAIGNAIRYNTFLNNGDLGIDLNNNGPTANDVLDADLGPNRLQNFPVITSATRSTSGAVIANGTLHSLPSTQFNVQLHYVVTCDASGFGEGSYVEETSVTTDAAGNGTFNFSMPFLPAGGNLTATATDPNDNTSELSACAPLVSEDPQLSIDDVTVFEGNAGTSLATFTVTLSAASLFPVTVNVQTSDGTANAGSDYVAAATMLTFAPGEITKSFSVTINGDTTNEATETFTVTLSGATNASIADGEGVGTITNDDAAAVAAIPSLSEFGLIAVAAILALLALLRLRA